MAWFASPSSELFAADPDAATQTTTTSEAKTNLFDLSLDQLINVRFDTVYGASRREQKTWEAPSSVTIVTHDEIQAFGYRTLADVLRGAPGIYITDDRYYSYLGIRGFSRPGDYNSRVLLLVDGHRANDNIYDSALIGQEALVDVDNIERVEVIRGPSSSLYGSSAFFGVINVVSRRGGDINGTEASVEGGSLDTFKGRLTTGKKFESGIEAMISASYYDSAGQDRLYFHEFDTPQSNRGIAENLDYERAWHLVSLVSYHDFTLAAGFESRTRGTPTASFGSVFNDPRAQSWDRASYVDLKYDRDISPDLHLQAKVGFHHYDYRGHYPIDTADVGDPPDVVLNKDDVAGDSWGAEFLATRNFGDWLTVTAGTDVRHNFRQKQVNFDDITPRVVYVDETAHSAVFGLYAQADASILTNLILSVGLRYDHYTTVGNTVNPRVGLMYRPWERTGFKALYGRAFRAPNAYETDYIAPGYAVNNHLRPETIQTIEGVWEQQWSQPYRTTASAFFYDVDDLIGSDYSSGLAQFKNLTSDRAYGIELSAEGRWTNGWLARVSYTAQQTVDEDTGNEISNAPHHLAKFHLQVPLIANRFSAGAEVLYVGSVKAVQHGRVDDYWLANLTLFSHQVAPGLDISASIYNLFDTAYDVTGGDEHLQRVLRQNGRTFRIKLTYKF